jgi:hypothetical protein
MNERDPNEYKTVLQSILEDIKSVNRLTNGLLELAQADMDLTRLKMQKVRIDELLWQTRNELLKRNPSYTVEIEVVDFPDEEGKLMVILDWLDALWQTLTGVQIALLVLLAGVMVAGVAGVVGAWVGEVIGDRVVDRVSPRWFRQQDKSSEAWR